LAVVLACALPAPLSAQEKTENPAHEELRSVRKAMMDAFNQRDIDALLKHVHKDVVVTWQNGEVSRGPAGIKKYFDRMLVGDQSVVVDIKTDPQVTELASLYGGKTPSTAVAYGKFNDTYKLRDGMDFNMDSLWSATLVKENDRWLIVAFHASTNVFKNDVLNLYVNRAMWLAGGIAGIAGLLIGLLVGRLSAGKKSA
jgi:ketosteroid isomerase-like protein